ncbi:DUF983 domain-containing protein [Sphingobacterium spiritivorum]|uniref:DUF983 domain-containing protein n=1 Tax=Sphingobacterium spiritivorum ATCC 33861 TaxID=525373 RepID=D7VTS2_SPHSI|nr:DUF983 domain-containing protein [Sphingobacterium spiritivorum]EFK55701.1 hypothetical protein HMPREF0766_14392 [Sphingobacterium spiritivorum ATCC 33861]QQT34169.1 DUF983 domain-containing protein [Sphingobacterium spiritivorum]WQD35005.1 DUF983 domain-containing protein [Sphingobacterium spiritivorum]SUI98995.1 Uncharacterised protein [Sphingobacterium spiritivorum]
MATSKFSALTHSKCPRCRVGKVFEGKAYGFRKQKMNEFCPVCGVKFEVEPGYFYAAMYVSYAFSVAQIVSLAVATYIITRSESPWLYLGVLFFTTLVFAPFNFRYSRLVLLHYMTPKISYNPRYEEEAADVEKQ